MMRVIPNESVALMSGYGGAPTVPKPIAVPWMIRQNESSLYGCGENLYQCAVTFEVPSTGVRFELPTDPVIGVSAKNRIVKRCVAHPDVRGTVKEYWGKDDYSVSIAGVLMSDTMVHVQEYVWQLREICEAEEAVKVVCRWLNQNYDILYVAIESVDFPFTPGMDSQAFTIKAVSDGLYDLDLRG